MKEKLAVIILAAGLGKRMGVKIPKVAISTREMPLILHVLKAVSALKAEKVIIVTGYQKELVEEIVNNSVKSGNTALKQSCLHYAFQEKQLGTGDAVKAALPYLSDFTGSVLILCGDTPLIQEKSLQNFISSHEQSKATISLISFLVNEENRYGRIIREAKTNRVVKITEAKDCTDEELKIAEVNSAVYMVDSSFLEPAVNELKNENAQKEFYLTDILERASKEGQSINAMILEDASEAFGINTLNDLNIVNRALIMNKIKDLINSGVIFELPDTCIVDSQAEIAAGVKIGPNTQILGKTKIAAGVIIEGNAYIQDSVISEKALIKFSVRMENASVGREVSVGPFANLRPETVLEDKSRIGNFVETKKTTLGAGAKANHLTYLGDCTVGKDSNIGAGTITCNYDGYVKSKTSIGNNVFIGSNSALVAPVTIEDGATVGAGSVITKTVEKDSLTFTRSPQVSKSGWSKSKRDKNKK